MMKFIEVPKEEWPKNNIRPPLKVFRNQKFLIQVIHADTTLRLTVNRTDIQNFKIDGSPNWKDGITWDELQEIKNSIGYHDKWMVEIYPPEDRVENVANMRHLWLQDKAPEFGWHNK